MASQNLQTVFDPRGVVEAAHHTIAPRLNSLVGRTILLLDNSKWNASKLLNGVAAWIEQQGIELTFVRTKKESFSRNASTEQLSGVAANCHGVITAIGD